MADLNQDGEIPFKYRVVTQDSNQAEVPQDAAPDFKYQVTKPAPPPPRPWWDSADVAKSGGTGLVRGIVGAIDSALTGGRPSPQDYPAWDSSKTKEENFAAMRPALEASAKPLSPVTDLYQEAMPGVMNYKPTSTAGGYVQTGAEFLPGMALPAGKGKLLGPALTRLARNVVAPAITSETAGLAAQKLFPDNESAEAYARLFGAFAGGPLGSGLETGIRAATSPSKIDPMISVLNRSGVKTTAGNVTRDQQLLSREAQAPRTAQILKDQPIQFRNAVLKNAGVAIPSEAQTVNEVLEQARRQSGSTYSRVTQGLNIVPSRLNSAKMKNIASTYSTDVEAGLQSGTISHIQKAVEDSYLTGKPIPAKQLGLWRSAVSAATRSPSAVARQSAIETLKVLDDVVGRSLAQAGRADDIKLLGKARSQYRDVLAIEGALLKAGKMGDEGMFMPKHLVSSLTNQGKTAFMRGRRGEMADLARAGRARLTPLEEIPQPSVSTTGRIIGNAVDAGAGLLGYQLGNKIFPQNPWLAGGVGTATGAASRAARNVAGSAYRNILASEPLQGAIKRLSQVPASGASPITGGVVGAAVTPIDQRQGRKAGGRVGGHEAEADQLVMAAERAKRGLSAHTEGLLNTPDDTVANALEIANRSI